MKLTVISEDLGGYDTGGGTREVAALVTVDKNLSPRQKRKVVLYEVLGACLDYVLPHE